MEYRYTKAWGMYSGYKDYLSAYESFVSLWAQDPYLHYLFFGAEEGINPSNQFDEHRYLEDKLTALIRNPGHPGYLGRRPLMRFEVFFQSRR